jgi:cytidine deaminase
VASDDNLPAGVSDSQLERLRAKADEARDMTWNPYSNYTVLAVVETVDGELYAGSNVENANYSLTVHAEQSAVLAALAAGARQRNGRKLIKGVYVRSPEAPAPCGGCRQFINEFVADEAYWVGEDASGQVQGGAFRDLLPFGFSPAKLGVED